MLPNPAWSPILEGPARLRAREILDLAVTDLGQFDRIGEEFALDASLAGGWAGMALFWAYLDLASLAPCAAGAVSECLSRAQAAAAIAETPVGLFAGFAGLGWVARHLLEIGQGASSGAALLEKESRAKVLAAIDDDALGEDFDLVNGWVGLAIYLFDCLPDREARAALERLMGRVTDRVDSDTGAWWTPPELLAPSHRPLTRSGQFNLGVAHGVPGVIWFLARAAAVGIEEDHCLQLLGRVVPWLLEQRHPEGEGSVFPGFVAPGFQPGWCRSAWCYGDPGAAAVLYLAARAVGEIPWQTEALAIARAAARRRQEVSGVVDACICHGAAGLAHLFNRLYQESGDIAFRDAAVKWFEDVIERQQPGTGVAGFSAAYLDANGDRHEEASPGLLEGTVGIGLALLAGLSDVSPDWDRMFLLSARSSSA